VSYFKAKWDRISGDTMISEKIQAAFNKQINAELYSSYLYHSMSAYFEANNLKGFAQWMKIQSNEEYKHAMKFYDHILSRNGRVQFTSIEGPKTEWKSPLEVFEESYKHELKITSMINSLVELTSLEKDNPGNSMLQWFVDEQVEEEKSTNDILQRLRMIKDLSGALFMLDHQLGKRGK
jgi:ferritin